MKIDRERKSGGAADRFTLLLGQEGNGGGDYRERNGSL